MKKDLLEYSKMVTRTKEFYNSLYIDIPDERLEEAVISLTMPKYYEEFNDNRKNRRNKKSLKNHHGALSTVGDAVCGAYWMKEKYTIKSTQEELTKEKDVLTNSHLNILGKKLLEGKLFNTTTDLTNSNDNENKKAYATAFEAVIGFISLIDPNKASEILDRYLNKEDLIINKEVQHE